MFPAVSLRLALAGDLESIQRLYTYIIGPPSGQERTWSRLIADGCMVVAEANGQIAGFGGIDTRAVEQLKWLYVMPEHQGAQIGTQLLKKLEEIGWSRGLTAIRLHAAPGAFLFYQKHGYREVEPDDVLHDHAGTTMIKDR
ncbi:MAG TPA: GNAT family N-acetyltransferase [Pyrinomonadaceae bacterium]|nr:GNAT family N-acetyltransferase [Pyrinomonadaceae bacterium]